MRGGAAEEPIVMRTLCWRELDSKFQFLGTFGSFTDLGDTRAAQRWKHCTKQKVRRRCAGGKWIRIFCSAGGFEASMFVLGRNLAFHRSSGSADRRRHRHQRGRLHSMAEADDCSDDTATPTVDRPQLGRSLETAAYLARNRKTLWGGRRGRGNFVAACNRWSAAMPQPNDLSSSLVALDQNSTIIAVVELSQSSCGRAPPAWVTWQVAVAREQSGQTWREYRARFGCEAIADSDRRGTGVCHHRSRSAATTIPTRPTTAIARIRSARQSAAKWNQPAIAQ